MTTDAPDAPVETEFSFSIPDSHQNHDRFIEMFLRDETFEITVTSHNTGGKTALAVDGMFTDCQLDDGTATFRVSDIDVSPFRGEGGA